MMVSCTKCSKMLKVKDEWAGKMLKCPQCGSTFRADPTGKVTGSAATGGTKPMPQGTGKPAAKPKGKVPGQKGGGIAINWGTIIMIGLLSLIPIGIILFLAGPMRVKKQWEAKQDQVHGEVTDVVEFAMKAYASSEGGWDPTKAGGQPSIGEVRMLPDIFSMSLPPTVKFDGYGSIGRFEGEYTFETGEIEMTLKTGGMMNAAGLYLDEEGMIMPGGQRENAPAGTPTKGGKLTPHRVTGHVKDNTPIVIIDGKKAEIFYPKPVDEDGNTIEEEKKDAKTADDSEDDGN